MRIFHNSRDIDYRNPYGAIVPSMAVTLTVDVFDAPNAQVMLRTWHESEGERLYEMNAVEEAAVSNGVHATSDITDLNADSETRGTRYRISIIPETTGVVWYHFIVTDEQGTTKRYGAEQGRMGGTGQMTDWEPPSFQLTVHAMRDLPPAWHEEIDGYLRDEGTDHSLTEIVETARENFPTAFYQTAYPWTSNTTEALMADEPSASSDTLSFFTLNDEVFGFWSRDDAGSPLCTLVNTSLRTAHDVLVALATDEVSELVGGYEVKTISASELDALRLSDTVSFDDICCCSDDATSTLLPERFAHMHLNPLGTCVLHFHATERLQRTLEPGMGVLAHITSLPAEGVGTLGKPAMSFVDWLAQTGARYWQVLPANPTDGFGSPYAGISAFAGNIRLLEGNGGSFTDPTPIPHASDKIAKSKKYRKFCKRESAWLEPYVAFMAISQKLATGLAWQEWPEPYRRYDPAIIAADEELSTYAEAWRQAQYLFDKQWNKLHDYANEHGLLIVGDMPIYVSTGSADVWAHPEIFQLDERGIPAAVAGCAPDAFAPEGQMWGNPLYDWEACRAQDYDWWLRRLQRAFELYDAVRLDHFIGFSRYFSIPAGKTALEGTYHPGPGVELFQKAYEKFGPLPVIAEDLGLITPAVRALSESCGFPGMDIAQFVDGNDPLAGYQPRPGKIAYTGTHDNQTLAGYCQQRYPHLDAQEAASGIMEKVAACSADVCVVPLQDLMGLDDEARMNVPGVAEGNWTWQADAGALNDALAQARKLVALHDAR